MGLDQGLWTKGAKPREVAYWRKDYPLNTWFYHRMLEGGDPVDLARYREGGDVHLGSVDEALIRRAIHDLVDEQMPPPGEEVPRYLTYRAEQFRLALEALEELPGGETLQYSASS